MMKTEIILASGSPRRRELLNRAGISFTVRASRAEEDFTGSGPAEMVEELSKRKAKAVAEEILLEQGTDASAAEAGRSFIVLGADTVVSVDGRILGKPADEEEACEMIRSIGGRAHEVYTGVCLIRIGAEGPGKKGLRILELRNFSECTQVHVVPMSEREIRDYVACGESMDKAGAYAIQGAFGQYIDRFEGDYENVIGLPLQRVLSALSEMTKEDADA